MKPASEAGVSGSPLGALVAPVPGPVTLITGFLGAGKTTLVNRMLRNADGLRIAVLVNDFGAINIDAELIEGTAGEIVSLRNGCICCSLAGGLQAAVSGVLRWAVPPDVIVVEGSGVTDPAEAARALSDPELRRYAPLDGIVTVVDAAGFRDLDPEARALAQQQVRTADLVLLNKVDLLDGQAIQAVEASLSALAPGIRILRCTNSDVPLSVLLGAAAQSGEGRPGLWLPAFGGAAHSAEAAFESMVVEQSQPLSMRQLHAVLSTLPNRVYRVKGVLHLAERPAERCILQAVGRRAAVTIGAPWGDDPRRSRIVFIAAKGVLDREKLNGRMFAAVS